MYRPLICLALGWIVGLWLANYMGPAAYWLSAVFAAALGCFFYCRYLKGLLAILFVLGVTVGATYFTYVNQHNTSFFANSVNGLGVGMIDSEPVVDGDRIRFDLQLSKLATHNQVLTIPKENIRIGVRLRSVNEQKRANLLRSNCKISLPLTLDKPAQASNPGAFDYAEYLHHYQIHWQVEIDSFSQIQLLSCRPTIITRIGELRLTLSSRLTALYPQKQAGLLQEMLLGEQQTLDPTTQ